MKLGTTYLCVQDIDKSLNFYRMLLQQEPSYCNDNRLITFDCGNYFSLYNKQYDLDLINNGGKIHFNDAYLETLNNESNQYSNNQVVLNFEVDDLKSEYERIKALGIGEVSKLLYVNIHLPYWYFTIKDPDGNEIEISGNT